MEDSAAFRKALRAILESRFPMAAVREAWGSKQALELMKSFGPQIVFMDIQLGGESGLELARCIKQGFPATPVVILTSHDLPEYREAALCAGASCFLSKGEIRPKEIEELVISLFLSDELGRKA